MLESALARVENRLAYGMIADAFDLAAACAEAGVSYFDLTEDVETTTFVRDLAALGTLVGCSTTIRLWRPQSYYDQPGRGTRASRCCWWTCTSPASKCDRSGR